jgi:membrane-associated protein
VTTAPDLLATLPLALGPSWLDPESLIETFGMIGLLTIVFVECGLLVGFFLPGDSLLFTAGLLSSNGTLLPDIWVLLVTIPIAAFSGDQLGYAIGRKGGRRVFKRPDSRLFHHEHVERAEAFFERHGPRTVILARFVPIIRTFAPVMAGVGGMPYRTFLAYDLVGVALWGVGVTTLGYFLGQVDFVRHNIELVLIAIVAMSVIPVALELVGARRRGRATTPPA